MELEKWEGENKRCAEAKKRREWGKYEGRPEGQRRGWWVYLWEPLLAKPAGVLANDAGTGHRSCQSQCVCVSMCVCVWGSHFCHICIEGQHLCLSIPLWFPVCLSSFYFPISALQSPLCPFNLIFPWVPIPFTTTLFPLQDGVCYPASAQYPQELCTYYLIPQLTIHVWSQSVAFMQQGRK